MEIVEGELNSITLSTGKGTSGEILSFFTNKNGDEYKMYDPERNIEVRNYSGEVKIENVNGTYVVKFYDNLDVDVSGWAIEFISDSDETMGNTTFRINENDSFEALQYPNKFTLVK